METTKGERQPKCALCRMHGVVTPLKGHKQICPWLRCKCEFCDLVDRRRKVMAAQIRLRRRQLKEDQARQNESKNKTCGIGQRSYPKETSKDCATSQPMSVIVHTSNESKLAEKTTEIEDKLKNFKNIIGLKKNPTDRRKYTQNIKRMDFVAGLDQGYRFPFGYSSAFKFVTDPVSARMHNSWMFKRY